MPRRVQDIVPSNHRSIRDIPIERNSISAPIEAPRRRASGRSVPIATPDVRRTQDTRKAPPAESTDPTPRISVTPPRKTTHRSRARRWPLIVIGALVLIAAIGYVTSMYFSQATFALVPKTIQTDVDGTYVLQHAQETGLSYEIGAVNKSASATVSAVDGPAVSLSSSGKVTIYNAYSSQSQRLIAGTRLASEAGRVYRLTSSVVIPGYTGSGSSLKPGSIVTTVTADKPGQEYDIAKTDTLEQFTIVAYKGTPRYETMYARINTDITGGFVGTKKVVDPAVVASTTARLQQEIIASAISQVAGTLPDGYITYDDGYVSSFSAPTIGAASAGSATITVQGTVYALLLREDVLVERIMGKEAIDAFAEFGYTAASIGTLDFSIANQKDFSPEKKNNLIIKLAGKAALVGSIPVDEIKTKLAGLALSETSDVLRSYKPVIDIEKSSGQITPPWARVPADPDRVHIEVLTE